MYQNSYHNYFLILEGINSGMLPIQIQFYSLSKEAAILAKSCQKDELSQNRFLDTLIRLETLADGEPETGKLSHKCRLATDRLLELGIKRFHKLLQGDLDQVCRNLKIMSVEINREILPSGIGQLQPRVSGESHKFNSPQSNQRFKILIQTLLKSGVYTDDIIVIKGKEPENSSIRNEPYYLVEIPKKDLQILVCEQASQATFISRGIIPRNDFFELDKEALQKKYPNQIGKLFWRGEDNWVNTIQNALDVESRPKIDIADREKFIGLIQNQLTSKQWIALTGRQASSLDFDNRSLPDLARKVFKLKKFSYNNKADRLTLGALIYGSNDTDIAAAQGQLEGATKLKTDKDYTINSLRDHFKDLDNWLKTSIGDRRKFKIHGFGLKIIGNILLNRKFDPDNPDEWRELGSIIFLEAASATHLSHGQKIADLRKKGADYIKTEFKKLYPDSLSLMKSTSSDSKNIKIDGVGITATAKILGVNDFSHSSKAALIKLGLEIYGVEDLTLNEYRKVYEALGDRDKLCTLLRESIQPDTWMSMNSKQIHGYRLTDISLLTVYHKIFTEEQTCTSLTLDQWTKLGSLIHGTESFQMVTN